LQRALAKKVGKHCFLDTLGRLVERHNGFLKHASYQKAVEQENQGASDTPSSPVK